jgi:hypothetical protein
MVSQRKISDLQAFEIETADDAGIGPKAAHELASPIRTWYEMKHVCCYLKHISTMASQLASASLPKMFSSVDVLPHAVVLD